jgi:hypothetical protein
LVTIYLPAPVAEGAKWYKYDTTRGWQDYTALGYATFADSRTVMVQLKDGAYGDADLTENGIIVDPGGPGVAVSGTVVLEGSDADTRAAGGCFIGAAASGPAAVDTGHGKAMGLSSLLPLTGTFYETAFHYQHCTTPNPPKPQEIMTCVPGPSCRGR